MLTAICEPVVYKMWEPRRLTTLWAWTACYRDSFTYFTFVCLTDCLSCFSVRESEVTGRAIQTEAQFSVRIYIMVLRYLSVYFEEQRKIMKNLSQCNCSPHQESNLRPVEYKTCRNTQPSLSAIKYSHYTSCSNSLQAFHYLPCPYVLFCDVTPRSLLQI
jgi:hypothetical protein